MIAEDRMIEVRASTESCVPCRYCGRQPVRLVPFNVVACLCGDQHAIRYGFPTEREWNDWHGTPTSVELAIARDLRRTDLWVRFWIGVILLVPAGFLAAAAWHFLPLLWC